MDQKNGNNQTNWDQANLFRVMEKVDNIIENIHKQMVLLVGLKGVGKTCAFNWITGKPMIGVKDISVSYQAINHGLTAAKMGDGFTFETLLPNVAELDADTTLLDMPAYLDEEVEHYVRAFIVPLLFKQIFLKADKIKFVIVIPEIFYRERLGESFIRTFQQFFSMFALQNMTTELKQKLFDSISLLITQTQQNYNSQTYLEIFLHKVNQPKVKCNKQTKPFMVELLTHLLQSKKISYFRKAKVGEYYQRCVLFKRHQSLTWNWLDNNVFRINDVKIINRNMPSVYSQINQTKIKQLRVLIDKKMNFLIDFGQILNNFVQLFNDQLKKFINQNNGSEKQFKFDYSSAFKFDYSSAFQSMIAFVQKGYVYQSKQKLQKIHEQNQNTSDLNQFSQSLSSFKLLKEKNIQLRQLDCCFEQCMNQYMLIVPQFIDSMMSLCQGKPDRLNLLQMLKFVMKRGFKSFKQIYEMDRHLVQYLRRDFKDRFFIDYCGFEYILLNQIPKQVWNKYFITLNDIESIIDFYERALNQCHQQQQVRKPQYLQQNLNNALQRKLVISFKENQFKQACFVIIRLLRQFPQKIQQIEYQSEIYSELYMKKVKLQKQLGQALNKLDANIYPYAKSCALKVCKSAHLFAESCTIYENMLKDKESNYQQLSPILKDYALQCEKYGFLSKAQQLWIKKSTVDIDNQNLRQYQECIKKLSKPFEIRDNQFLHAMRSICDKQHSLENVDLQKEFREIQEELYTMRFIYDKQHSLENVDLQSKFREIQEELNE